MPRSAPDIRAGLIGANIERSRFHAGLTLLCDAAGLTLEFERIDTAGRRFDFEAEINRLRQADWTGVAVTHPWKTHAAALAGTGEVQQLGAANLLIFEDPLRGANTDYTGFLGAWAAEMDGQSPGAVAMMGAGGVARAIGPALMSLGATELWIIDLDQNRAKALARDLGRGARAVAPEIAPTAIAEANGLVNATPLGMTAHPGTAVPPDLIGPQDWAFDAVYTPTDTTFLIDARAAGLTTLSGFALFTHMLTRSFEALTGHPAPEVDLTPLRPD